MRTFIYKSFIIVFITFYIQKVQAQDPNWSVNSSDFQYSMTFTAFLSVDGVILTSPNDKVAAFVNGEIRGVSNVTYISNADKYVSFLSVYANTNGETISFKIYNSATEMVVDVDRTRTFNIDENVGGIFQSYSIASPALNENAAFDSFSFSGITAVSTDISSDEIHIVLPENTSLTALTPLYQASVNSKVYVNDVIQESGTSTYDFTNPIIYKILSEDESAFNEYEVTVSLEVNVDPLTVSISSSESMNTNTIPVSLDISFSNDVSGFNASDFILENAIISSFSTINSKNYTVEMIPLSQGIFTAQIPDGIAVDENNIQNEISNKIEFNYDILKPLISDISVDFNADLWWFVVTFNEDVLNVDELDFELKGVASGGLTISSVTALSANQYKVDISNSNTDIGVISLQLKSTNDIKDNAENIVVLSDFEAYFLNFDNRFIGTTDSDWDTASNWSLNSVPTSADNVRINNVTNQPVIDATTDASVNDLNIDTGGSLTINGGGSLIVSGTSTGNITYKRTLAATDKWYLVSAPVSGETIQNLIANHTFATGTPPNIGLAPYDNTQVDNNNKWDYQTIASTGSVNTGQGYSVRLAIPGDISFTGTMNTNNINIAIAIGAGNAFNLIGNPYTSYINSATFLTTNTGQLDSETIWIWNQATDMYDTKVASQNFKLAPAQGFFVECGTAGNVTFAKTNQSHEGTDTFQRQTIPEIKLLIADESTSRYAEIYYHENATTGFDNGYDGELFRGIQNSFEIYSHLLTDNQNKKYQIQSLPNSDYESMVIPVGIKADAGKEITFSAEAFNLPTGLKVFLEDKETTIFTRLDEANTNYTVTLSEALDGVGRFYIHTSASALTVGYLTLSTVHVYQSDDSTVRIVGLPQGNATVKLYNVLGKQIKSTSFNDIVKDISLPKLAAGIYIVEIQTEVGKLNKKIVLQ